MGYSTQVKGLQLLHNNNNKKSLAEIANSCGGGSSLQPSYTLSYTSQLFDGKCVEAYKQTNTKTKCIAKTAKNRN